MGESTHPCSTLFPDYTGIPSDSGDSVMLRPPVLGGHIRLIQYRRYLSNRLRLYGPFDRFVDYARLLDDLKLNDIYDKDRYPIQLRMAIMGVAEEERLSFQDQIFPSLGMECGTQPVQDAT